MAIPRPARKQEPEIKRGILVTTSYTPPRLSTIEWVDETRASVIVTKQNGEDQTHMSEPSRRRPKHAVIPWNGDIEILNAWRKKISDVANVYTMYLNYVTRLDAEVEGSHVVYLTKEEHEAQKKGK
jgi:hypothetical protein